MSFPYKPPRRLAHLATTVNAARTQVGWGVHDDGSVGLEHIMSANPFAGKAKVWGIANIDDNGDIQIVSNGPGNDTLDAPLPQDLVQQIVHFYEKEGLNVRNVHESDPTKQKQAEVENGMKACPHCGENNDLYLHPAVDSFECLNCGTVGDSGDLIDFGEDPDPDRNVFEDGDDYPDQIKNDDWADYESKTKEAAGGFSVQGAPASGDRVTEGIAVRPDVQSKEEIQAVISQLGGGQAPHNLQREFNDKVNEGMGTSFPRNDSPFLNRGGSTTIDDHFLDSMQHEAADPVGIPGDGMGDTRNFQPQNRGYIVVTQYTTNDDNWLIYDPLCMGIVTATGGYTSHAAVEARGAGIPCVVQADGIDKVQPGDNVRLDASSGRVDINGGAEDFQMGDVMQAHRELVRFVWSSGQGVFTPVTKELTAEMAEEPYHPGDTDRSHQSILEYMEDEDLLDYNNYTIGVIYDDGEAQFYQPINDEPQMENWLKSNFPDLVHKIVYKQTQGGLYAPALAKAAASDQDDAGSKSPECPECGSHTYDVVSYPDGTVGEGQLRCLNDGTIYPWTLIMNPRTAIEDPEGEDYDYKCPHCGEALTDSDLDADECPKCGGSLRELTAMIKEAPGKDHLPYATPKRNRQYEHILESCRDEHPDWSEDRCKELAARTVNKEREEKGETKSSVDDDCGCSEKESKLVFSRRPGLLPSDDFTGYLDTKRQLLDADPNRPTPTMTGPGQHYHDAVHVQAMILSRAKALFAQWVELRPQADHDELWKQALQYAEEMQPAQPQEVNQSGPNGDIAYSSTEISAVNDTQGQPLKIGELYLMHSTQYKIPDVVRITNINEKRIEAHIDSDVRGMFPIEIDPAEFANLGYSFEPYVTKQADARPTDQLLYTAVQTALQGMITGTDSELQKDPSVNEAVQKAIRHFGDPQSALNALNDADSFTNFMRYYSRKEAARALHVSPKRQKELINENMGARARNFDKLNLEGTHYTEKYDLVPRPQDDEIDAYFLW